MFRSLFKIMGILPAFFFSSKYPRVTGLVPVTPPAIQISTTKTLKDWHDLADIRYNEWIVPTTESNKSSSSFISRQAFQRATIDIYQNERPNAVTFLVRLEDDEHQHVVIGAGELSPSELENALLHSDTTTTTTTTPVQQVLYVTDVVTDRRYRRQGIAAMLMREMETYAATVLGVNFLVLNVAKDNNGAFAFYKKLGYEIASKEFLQLCNIDQLLQNAGTQGQETLSKRIAG